MSPVHGNQGQPFGRPAAPSQANSQWPQQPQAAPQGYAYGQGQAYPAPNQPTAPPAPNGYGQPAQQPAGYGQSLGGYGQQPAYGGYGVPDAYAQPPTQAPTGAPAAGSGAATGGRAPASYAPQFEPYSPAPVQAAPTAQARPQGGHQHAPFGQPQGPQGSQGYAAPASQGSAQHVGYASAYGAPPAQHQGYGSPHAAQQPAPQAPQAPQSWGQPSHPSQHDPRGFDLGTYSPSHQPYAQEPGFASPVPAHANEWPQDGYATEPQMYAHPQDGQAPGAEFGAPPDYAQDPSGHDMGFGQAAGGELDQGYVDEEAQDYETEAPSRWRRPLLMAAVLIGAIMVGGGSMYVYKALLGGPQAGEPPVVKSASQPTKVKPEQGGGKQFAHTDSKIMGRLGDGSSASPDASGSDVDANGTRKVATLVVGRDGSIQAPAPAAEAAPMPPPQRVNVPGLTVVDGLGTAPAARTPPVTAKPVEPEPAPVVAEAVVAAAPAAVPTKINAPPAKNITKIAPPAEATGSIEPEAPSAGAAPAAAPAKPKKVKTAAAAAPVSDAASTSVATTGSGFVAVLASVPRSNSSRMDALKRFADMQQKYASVLSGKTPDVAEANLGTKGSYHRLVVGPPGSREQASSVCTQLKSQGYNDCWVTSY